jgi:hypothetical protein
MMDLENFHVIRWHSWHHIDGTRRVTDWILSRRGPV